ncbi:(d)CMP kinase [Caldibacillus lycopersici]|uniref:Cytidylate kinase n=1 Tax=Perspicuibacillus lycopersici TaxID=1325689 RepID=A0AAE3LTA7_9BACI|nr:(d)CMP kinase [Perspicuibacillus lycopersici]MCU9613723.1 (d)CMP kinase [Perspicuibacillus lycopersici]
MNSNKKRISIAIDGPAAAGKSTVAKIIAQKLAYLYIDTGAMYRSLTWKALQAGVDIEDEVALYDLLMNTKIELIKDNNIQKVFVDNQEVTDAIRLPDVTTRVSAVSKHELVRKEMVKRQQLFATNGGVVMDGRDIGTHVLPDAEVKVFLLASVDERAIRRHEENTKKGIPSDLEQLKDDIARRDKLDSEREIAPLKKADDAVEIDTTSLSIDQVVERIMELVWERVG